RIELEVPTRASLRDVTEVVETTDPSHVEAVLELALKNSDALKFTLAQVAAKFGALKRYQGRERFGADRLLAALEDTPVYDEAVREVFHVDLAVDETADLLDRLRDDETNVRLETAREHTPIGTGGRSSGRELLVPENADASVIEAVKERIRNDRVRLLCLHCADWERKTKVRRVRVQPECPE
ncbi:helicase, partial [Haloferax sp. Atlit-6N]